MASDYQGNKTNHIGLRFALKGIAYAFSSEWNMRMHGFVFLTVIVSSIFFQLSSIEWILVIFVSGLVMITEIFNTVIEHLLDYLAPEKHPTIGKIKDMAAGAVFIAALLAIVVGCIIFLPKLTNMF
ncbi:Undecaprenol kinase [Paraliobacillus sp. PM-2]|uniref:diacylglycerol kinase family protein n=1 Tax=Paraliobacillus sp. PM-2 TaxID=1462524 RepID=UPI00061B9053|nr:diacylglycerol kinase family protein [Paraliobacillus sp. PM-2]CQR46880.1 Undecaprenol kinase [Paraliobacillus sp. PM-2]